MSIRYPKNPHFHCLTMNTTDFEGFREERAHDPSLLEWQGKYYAYSTDTFGAPNGCQIRESDDLKHWRYAGAAFHVEKSAQSRRAAGLEEAFLWCVTDAAEASAGVCAGRDGAMSFWAPHCVRGTDGKFWLYYCLTGYFGGSKSCIGVAKSDSPAGPFVGEKLLVRSPAGWRTPNAIDPQVFFAEGRMFLVYGSFGMGLYLVELDPNTGFRKNDVSYEQFAQGKVAFRDYYGVNLARGSLEGGVIRYHEGVRVMVDGKPQRKNFYYLMCSYGSLSSVYHIRCGRSEHPEGPYLDVNGNELVCSTDLGTGNKLLGSFRWRGDPVDAFCPGHNDMFVTQAGVNLISYHCRTNYFVENKLSASNNFHYLYLGQYAFNADGWCVVNANRYAGEELQRITAEELLKATGGEFEAVLFSQSVAVVEGKKVRLNADGTVDGAYRGVWRLYGDYDIDLTLDGETYCGVVMPCWIAHKRAAGLTVSALGRKSGMAIHLNARVL